MEFLEAFSLSPLSFLRKNRLEEGREGKGERGREKGWREGGYIPPVANSLACGNHEQMC
jgi:hypothetical protein